MNDNSSDGEDDYGDLEDESEGRNKEDMRLQNLKVVT